jgi:hypothetical protein
MFHYGEPHYFIAILFFLIVGHAFFDFPGQGLYLSVLKDPNSPEGQNGRWRWGLFYHSIMHAGSVAFFTHSLILGVFEGITHSLIDYLKCRKAFSFHIDQWIHIGLKVLWAICVAKGYS